MLNRRHLILGTLAAAIPQSLLAASGLDAIEATLNGGRLGVAAIDLGTRRMLLHRARERFASCSVFKVPLAAAVLAGIDAGMLRADQPVPITERDLLSYAPATRAALPHGQMSVEALCDAAVVLSDNSAANLLLRLIGGPAGLTRFVRDKGDRLTSFDRTEPTLNTNLPGDPRDTSTPRAMLGLLEPLLVGDALSPASRSRLLGWMTACTTGKARLRAGLPSSWAAGDKTGTGERGAVNDVAIAWPVPHRPPLLITCFIDAPDVSVEVANAAQAAVGRLAASLIG